MIDQQNEYECPHCGADLRGDPLPREYVDQGLYSPDSRTHYSRKIGIEERGVYDGILYWMCPDCGGKWHRWTHNSYLRDKAEELTQ